MLRIVPGGWFSREVTVFDGEKPVARISLARLRESAEMTIDGIAYKVYREGGLRGQAFVLANGAVFVRAEKPSAWGDAFVVEYEQKRYRLEARSGFSRRFTLREEDGLTVGSGYKEGFFSGNIKAELPEELPLAVRVFIVYLVFIIWRRQATMATTTSASIGST